ncbi:hypothetical protein [Tsukamurella soli]|uniref:Uncharacterized protein n=1 Tax=Tsukamurella soli TaxID=644556 RepID=A0ABP8JS52_9ACTN
MLVADGHTTTTERGPDPVDAASVVAHYNAVFTKIATPTDRSPWRRPAR